jgi:acyl-coenzyme A synthetase/AMP-(fatty) acid ligase
MMIEFLVERMEEHGADLGIATPNRTWSYREFLTLLRQWRSRLDGLPRGSVVSVEGPCDAESVAVFLALIAGQHVVLPLSPDSSAHHNSFLDIAGVEFRITLDGTHDQAVPEPTGRRTDHPLYGMLREHGHPGLLLFSSGSTGQPKAAVHDLTRLMAKYRVRRQRFRTLVFLLLDHIGGVNTLFYTISNGGAIVFSRDRSPSAVCEAIEAHQVELLPTSPTFLNLLLLSGECANRNLNSLRLITYGTEPMPPSTLEQACVVLPHARFLQTYGLTEVGILRSQSRDSNSLWVRIGGEDFDWKIVNGRLWVRATSAMLGYLNASSPFDSEGFFDTGDLVETDGDWIRFLGRESDVINVGGSKVHPAEVENVLLQMENVADVIVGGEPHAFTGQIVVATVRLMRPEPPEHFKLRMRQFCGERLQNSKIPARVRFTEGSVHSARFKRMRSVDAVPGSRV